jgi:hypothetical protein
MTPSAPDPAVTRRLAFIPDPAQRARYAKRWFEDGEPIAYLARELGLSSVQAGYCLRQQMVESTPRLRLAATREAVRSARHGEFGDIAWLTCRIGRSGYRLDQLLD